MNRKIVLSVFLIAIIALALASWVVHNQISALQTQISELQAQNSDLQNQIRELQAQNSELQDQNNGMQDKLSELRGLLGIPSVKVTAFDWIEGFNPYVGLMFVNEVKVTVENQGTKEISGITLTVKLLNNGTMLYDSQPFVTEIDALHAGESREILGNIFWASLSTTPTHCVSTLTFGDVVLDEWTYSF